MSSSKSKGKARPAQQAQQARRPAASPAGSPARADNLNRGKNGNGVSGGGAALSGKNGNAAARLRNRRTPFTSRPATSGTRRPDNTDAVQSAPAPETSIPSFAAGAGATSLQRDMTDFSMPTLPTAARAPAAEAALEQRPARGRTTAAIAEPPAPT